MNITVDKTPIDVVDSNLSDAFRDIFSHTFESIARVDSQGCFLSVNAAYAAIFTYGQEEMIGMSWNETVHQDDIEKSEKDFQQLLDEGRCEGEIRGIRKDGSTFYKQYLLVKGLDSSNSSVHHYCFIKDITERLLHELTVLKSVKAGLELQEQQFYDLTKDIPGVIFRSTPGRNWSFSFISGGIEKLVGIPSYRLLAQGNQSYAALICSEDRERVKQIVDSAIIERRGYSIEYRIRRSDGEIRWFSERATSSVAENGIDIIFGGIIRDITESRESEKQLQIAKALIDNAGDLVFWVNEDGKFIYVNNIACEVLAYERDELLQLYIHDIDKNFTQQTRPNHLQINPTDSTRYETAVSTKNANEIRLDVVPSIVEIYGETYNCIVAKDITKKNYDEQLNSIEKIVIDSLFANTSDKKALETLCRQIEETISLSRTAVFLSSEDGKTPGRTVSPRLQESEKKLIIETTSRHIKNANNQNEDIIVVDLASENSWIETSKTDKANSYKSCWIIPNHNEDKTPAFSLTILLVDKRSPTDLEIEFLHRINNLINLLADITGTRQQALRFDKIVDSANDLIMYVDTDYRFRAVSKRYAASYGLNREDVIGRYYADIVGDELFYSVIKPYLDRGLSGEHFEFSDWFKQPHAGRAYYHVKIDPVYEAEKLIGLSIIMRDSTQLINISEALEDSENRYQDIVDNSADVMIITNLEDGRIRTVNKAFTEVTGYEENDVIDTRASDIYFNADDRLALVDKLKRFGRCSEFETQIKASDGRSIPVLLSSNLIEYHDEQCVFTVARDISERKMAERALNDKNRSISLLQKITVAANDASSVEQALQICLDEICVYCSWPIGHAYVLNSATGLLESSRVWHFESQDKFLEFRQVTETASFKTSNGLPGRILATREPAWIEDTLKDDNFPRARAGKNINVTSAFGFPALVGDKVVAVLEFFNDSYMPEDEQLLGVVCSIGVQVGRIIERKNADTALHKSQINFRKAVDTSPDSVIIIRIGDRKILDFNDAVLATTGYSKEDLLEGGNGMMFWASESACKEHARELRKLGKIANHSMQIKRKNGTVFPCLMSSTMIEVEGSQCAFSIVKDMSDITIAYEHIREVEKQTQLISDSASVFVSYIDTELRYRFNNLGFTSEFPSDGKSVIGKTIAEVVGKTNYKHIKKYITKALQGEDVRFEFTRNFSNKGKLVYEITYHPDVNDGVTEGIYITSANITKRKETEEALLKTNRALRVLSECNDLLVKKGTEEDLLQEVCDIAVNTGGYYKAWIDQSTRLEHRAFRSHNYADESRMSLQESIIDINSQLGQDLIEKVQNSGKPLVFQDISEAGNDLNWRDEVSASESVSVIGLPLKSGKKTLGVMVISSVEKGAFDDEERGLLVGMAENIAYGIQSIRDGIKRVKAEELLALENHVFQMIGSFPALPALLNDLLINIEPKLDDYSCSIMLLGDNKTKLHNIASPRLANSFLDVISARQIGDDSDPCGRAAYLKERIVVENTHDYPYCPEYEQLSKRFSIHSCCVTPLVASNGRILGTFAMYSELRKKPGAYDLQVIDRMVHIIAGVVERYQAERNLEAKEERFALAMRATQDGLWDIDLETKEVYWSARWKSMLGYAEDELTPDLHTFLKLLHPEDNNVYTRILEETEDNLEIEFRLQHKDGHYVDILSRGTALHENGGSKVTRIVGTHVDLTQRKQTTNRIQESERQFRTLYDDSPSMFFTLDSKGIILSINKFGADHLGMTVSSLIDRPILEITHGDDASMYMQKIQLCTEQPHAVQKCEIRIIHEYGDAIWVRATMRSIGLESKTRSILVTCEDISEARILSEQLEYQAKHDSLTGLINRVEFEKRLRRVLHSESDDADHALCYLDLDQFKIINDTCGHRAGDELLRRISDILNTVVRKRDTLARMGGDEFAVLLEHCSIEQAKRVAEQLRHCVETLRFVWEGKRFTLGVSIGLVPMRSGSGTMTDLLSAADESCYAAKDAGRNRVHVYYSDDVELSRRRGEMEWVSKINQALEEDRFCMEMQAISSLDMGINSIRGKHYELLVRMRDKDNNLIYPGSFMPAAERYNLTEKIDRWVVGSTLKWLMNNETELKSLAVCSINLSGHSMGNDDFLKFLMGKFKQYPVPPQKICFEITETVAIGNLGAAIQFINALKEIGCLFALDDFGTGVSSFNYLKNLPVDFLKIDGSFIREIDKDPIDYAMVRSINEIGQVMGKLTIAEFVESEAILNVLRDIGVNYAQGYAVGNSRLITMN